MHFLENDKRLSLLCADGIFAKNLTQKKQFKFHDAEKV